MAVVPSDELGCRPRSREIFAGDPKPFVGLRADRVDHGVVETHEVRVREIASDFDVAEEPKARFERDLLERP